MPENLTEWTAYRKTYLTWKKRLIQLCLDLSLYIQSNLVNKAEKDTSFLMAVISFLSYVLLGLVLSQVDASATAGSLLFTRTHKTSSEMLHRGRTYTPSRFYMCPASHGTSRAPVKSSRMTAIQTIISNNFPLTRTCQQNLHCHGSVYTARQGSCPGLFCLPLTWMVAAGISPLLVILLSTHLSMCNYQWYQIAPYLIKTQEIIPWYTYSAWALLFLYTLCISWLLQFHLQTRARTEAEILQLSLPAILSEIKCFR